MGAILFHQLSEQLIVHTLTGISINFICLLAKNQCFNSMKKDEITLVHQKLHLNSHHFIHKIDPVFCMEHSFKNPTLEYSSEQSTTSSNTLSKNSLRILFRTVHHFFHKFFSLEHSFKNPTLQYY